MWLVYLRDGYIYATSSEYQVKWLEETYDVMAVTFTDYVDYAIEKCDEVLE
jgi:hypothetical protein